MQAHQATAVEIAGRAIMIEGEPGNGKSSLALALIDRGATLIGDDGLMLEPRGGRLIASPHPNTRGLIEVRNLGLVEMAVSEGMPVALIVQLDRNAPRFIESAQSIDRLGICVPLVALWPDSPVLAIKAELALQRYGLA
ncbi:MAG: HPr kinase/phosphatase C-terminal domain-containing protein [Novosphingobium sp.]|nr:HPr kinase/phosphatase C-terminal domain-containing protein [Novosphingobium sp.]